MHMTHTLRILQKKKKACKFTLAHIHTLPGVDTFALTDLLKTQGGQIHAGLLLWMCLQLSLTPHPQSPPPSLFWRHSHITYNTAFTSLTDVPRGKTALKNSHRWCYTPPASVTSQTVLHSPSPPQRPVSLIWFSEVDGFQQASSSASFQPCLQIHNCLISVQSTPAPRTACLNLWTFIPMRPVTPIVPLLPAIALATSLISDWQFSWCLRASISC